MKFQLTKASDSEYKSTIEFTTIESMLEFLEKYKQEHPKDMQPIELILGYQDDDDGNKTPYIIIYNFYIE